MDNQNFQSFLERFEKGEWRTPVFRDLILAEFERIPKSSATILDIGCGHGFDMEARFQREIAIGSAQYVGVEPDEAISTAEFISPVYRSLFEAAPIPPASIDVAFAVMVLEHLPEPTLFWNKLYDVLKPGGVFWGFTVNRHHPFARASLAMGRLGVKDLYLNWLIGKRSEGRYENYPTFYRSNTPEDVRKLASRFRTAEFLKFKRSGELNAYLPKVLHPVSGIFDHVGSWFGLPGSAIMVVRVVK